MSDGVWTLQVYDLLYQKNMLNRMRLSWQKRGKRKWGRRQRQLQLIYKWFKHWLEPIWFSLILGSLGAFGLYYLRHYYSAWGEITQGVYIEFSGAVFDLLIFGVVISLTLFIAEKRRSAARLQEEIDDFKKWNSEEAHYRIAGAIRRLNRQNRTNIDFGGLELSKFSFISHGISSLRGSTFYDGTWGTAGPRDHVRLEDVDFSKIDCRDVTFSKFNPLGGFGSMFANAHFLNCDFSSSDLRDAKFVGALLEWSEEHPDELGVYHDDEDGYAGFEQTYYPPFDNADLMGASFKDAVLKNADFRNAQNIQSCDFSGAKQLSTCIFDSDELKEEVIEKSKTS